MQSEATDRRRPAIEIPWSGFVERAQLANMMLVLQEALAKGWPVRLLYGSLDGTEVTGQRSFHELGPDEIAGHLRWLQIVARSAKVSERKAPRRCSCLSDTSWLVDAIREAGNEVP